MDKIIPEIYLHNVNVLTEAIKEGYVKEFFTADWTVKDNNLLSRVQNNIFAFSGAKTYAEMQELRDAVYEDGKLLSPGEFRKRAKKINATYNETYLEVERKQVVASATQGSRWIDIENSSDTHPFLEYVTARDEHVREEHRGLDGLVFRYDDPFYRQYYPPNGWGPCRCTTRKRTEREYEHLLKNYKGHYKSPMPDSDTAQKIAGKVVAKPFRQNVGTAEIFERDGHPYFRANKEAKEMQLSAVKNYGMKPAKDIYLSDKKLSRYKGEVKDENDFREYWEIMESHYGKKGEGFTLVDRKRNIEAYFDNDLKNKILNRGRHVYFDEAIDVFKQPDEIWGTFKGGKKHSFKEEYFNVYIKYYEDRPVLLLVNKDGRVDSFYKLESVDGIEDFRKGLLKKK